jgi:hypothetical protein
MPEQGSRGRQGGAVAQLGERVNGIHEVSGSIPLGSTMSPFGFSETAKWDQNP